jgi:prevent-host-death family protein
MRAAGCGLGCDSLETPESSNHQPGRALERPTHREYRGPCHVAGDDANLVRVTRIRKSKPTRQPKLRRRALARRRIGYWALQDAKARFSELVRRVRSEGPQHVTVHGRDEVVVVAAEEFRRLEGDPTGQALVAAMQASPHRDIDIEPGRVPMPVRGVAL